jgi:hypothetical protein
MNVDVKFAENAERFGVKFDESAEGFNVGFGDIKTASGGGYERGYEEGYASGKEAGYTDGYTNGSKDGIAQGYNSGMDAIVNQTATYYRNDTIVTLKVSFFSGNTNLETIILPKVTHLNGFSGCTALKYCDFSGAQYIQSGAFMNCTSLERIEFPIAAQIHSNVFKGCTSLRTLVLRPPKTVTSLGNTASFEGTKIGDGEGYIYVADNLVEKYKTATNWSTFASQIKPLSELEG